MQQTYLVGGVQRLGDLLDDPHGTPRFQWSVSQHAAEVSPFDNPHVDIKAAVDFALVMNWNDVWVVQSCGRVSFPAESSLELVVLRQMWGQKLEGNDPVGVGVVGSPNLAHAAATQ